MERILGAHLLTVTGASGGPYVAIVPDLSVLLPNKTIVVPVLVRIETRQGGIPSEAHPIERIGGARLFTVDGVGGCPRIAKVPDVIIIANEAVLVPVPICIKACWFGIISDVYPIERIRGPCLFSKDGVGGGPRIAKVPDVSIPIPNQAVVVPVPIGIKTRWGGI